MLSRIHFLLVDLPWRNFGQDSGLSKPYQPIEVRGEKL